MANPATFVALGALNMATPLLALFGLALTAILSVRRVRGAILIGIVATTALAWTLGAVTFKPQPYALAALGDVAFRLDPGVVLRGGPKLLEVLFAFLFVNLFDNIGTLVGVTRRAGLMDAHGNIPGLNRILLADAAATMAGAALGTSTVTSYVESAAGVQAGGRTGLTAVVAGLLFLAALFVAPYVQLIPAAATAPALILVGALMMAPLAEIEWDDPFAAIPAFLTIALVPLTFSIVDGLAAGIVAHALLKLARGKAERGDWLLFVLAALFVARFGWLAVG